MCLFLCGAAVNKTAPCSVAVTSNPTVCNVYVSKSTVFSGTKLSVVFLFSEF